MPIRKIFPRGFEIVDPSLGLAVEVREVEGSKEAYVLFRDWLLTQTQSDAFTTMCAAKELAHTLFGARLSDWYRLNIPNEYLNNNLLNFMEDTISYIVTGKRRIGLENWNLILNSSPMEPETEPRVKIKPYSAIVEVGGYALFNEENYVSAWLSHPNGLTDLIQTLNIVFGDVKVRAVNPRGTYNAATHKAIYGVKP